MGEHEWKGMPKNPVDFPVEERPATAFDRAEELAAELRAAREEIAALKSECKMLKCITTEGFDLRDAEIAEAQVAALKAELIEIRRSGLPPIVLRGDEALTALKIVNETSEARVKELESQLAAARQPCVTTSTDGVVMPDCTAWRLELEAEIDRRVAAEKVCETAELLTQYVVEDWADADAARDDVYNALAAWRATKEGRPT